MYVKQLIALDFYIRLSNNHGFFCIFSIKETNTKNDLYLKPQTQYNEMHASAILT